MLNGLFLILSLFTILTSCQVKSPELMQGEAVAEIYNPGNFSVVIPNNGWKKLGDTIELTLLFPYDVTVTGSPYIKAYFSSSTGAIQTKYLTFDYLSSSAQSLKFSYTVGPFDEDVDGIIFDNFIQTGGGHISYFLNGILTDCPLVLNYPSYEIKVDGIAPIVTEIFKPISGNYVTGNKLNYTLNFSEKVFVNPLASIDLTIGTTASTANYFQGSGTKIVTFQKTLLSSESDTDGITNSSILDNPEYITDVAGNIVYSILPSLSSSLNHVSVGTPNPIIYANIVAPFVSSVTTPSAGAYTSGNLDFTLNFNTPVKINTSTGIPGIKLIMDSQPVFAYYLSGSGTNQIKFRHTIGPNELVTSLSIDSQIYLFGGTIKNTAETVSASLYFSAPTITGTSINTMQSTYVTNILLPSAGTYKAGDVVYFTLVFNRSVTVNTTGGTPTISIPLNSGTISADYDSGSGSNQIRFKYTVQASDYEPDGILISPTISLNSGTIVDYLGANVYTTMATGLNSSVKIDAVAPVLSSITSTANGTYKAGDIIQFKATFNKNVYVTGTPTLTVNLNTSSTTALATYSSGSGTNQLTFKYVVSTGHLDTDGITVSSLNLPTSVTIKDIFGANATITIATPIAFASVKVDAVAPILDELTTSSTGTFGLGETMQFEVTFLDAVEVVGTPRIVIGVGNQLVYANYSHTTSSTNLIFKYTITSNLLDTDGIMLMSELDLNGGQIQDVYGNRIPQGFFLDPLPDTSSILVDSRGPLVTGLAEVNCPTSGLAENGRALRFDLTFDEVVTVTNNPQIQILANDKIYMANYLSGTGSSTIRFEHLVQGDELDLNGIAVVSPMNFNNGTIKDAKSNLASLTFGGATFLSCKVDGIIPKIEAFYPPANNLYAIGDKLTFRVVWSENVTIDTTSPPSFSFTLGSTTKSAPHISTIETVNPFIDPVTGSNTGRVSIFQYTIQSGDVDNDGISIANVVTLNSGVTDSAGNLAIDNLPSGSPTSLSGVKVDGSVGTITSVSIVGGGNPFFPHYKAYTNVMVKFKFSKAVIVTGAPKVKMRVGTTSPAVLKTLTYLSGSGSDELLFTYDVEPGTNGTGIKIIEPFILTNGKMKDLASNDLNLDFATLSDGIYDFYEFSSVNIDTTPPTIITDVNISNTSSPTQDNAFFPSEEMKFVIEYSETVNVSGNPRIPLTIGSQTRYATFDSSIISLTDKTFKFTIDAGDTLLDLDGVEVGAIQLNGGTMLDVAGNQASLSFNYTDKDYVYFDGFFQRYNISEDSYTPLTSSPTQIDELKNLTQKDGRLTNGLVNSLASPTFQTTGFGTNNKGYMDFSSNAGLVFQDISAYFFKTIILVMKTPNTFGGSNNVLLATWDGVTSVNNTLYVYPSGGIELGTGFTPEFFRNGDSLNPYSSYETWGLENSKNYVAIFRNSSFVSFNNLSIIGATYNSGWNSFFKGQIAEIIILDDDPSDTKIQTIRNQLNAIYGIY